MALQMTIIMETSLLSSLVCPMAATVLFKRTQGRRRIVHLQQTNWKEDRMIIRFAGFLICYSYDMGRSSPRSHCLVRLEPSCLPALHVSLRPFVPITLARFSGECILEELHAIEDEAIRAIMNMQRETGIKARTDVEFRRHMFFQEFRGHEVPAKRVIFPMLLHSNPPVSRAWARMCGLRS